MTAAVGARNLFKAMPGVVHALLQARYYDGSKGEFLSEDPVSLGDPKQQVLADPQGLNSYSEIVGGLRPPAPYALSHPSSANFLRGLVCNVVLSISPRKQHASFAFRFLANCQIAF